jgi:hypothetical protein
LFTGGQVLDWPMCATGAAQSARGGRLQPRRLIPIPTQFGPYTLNWLIGRGGMGGRFPVDRV